MSMIDEVQRDINLHVLDELAGIEVAFTERAARTLSKGTTPFISLQVLFKEDRQLELGNTERSRQHGSVLAILYTRADEGPADRNHLYEQVRKAFRSRKIGRATFLNVQLLRSGESENWCMTAYQIPFYFTILQ